MNNPLSSPTDYENFIYNLPNCYPFIKYSKEYWYDSFPHPNDPTLAVTHPHHKHIPPDIKHHRIPAFDLTFTAQNLSFIIEEIAARWNLE